METEEEICAIKLTFEQSCLVWKQIILLKKKGKTEQEISEMVGFSLRRVQEIWKRYRETGKIPVPKIRGRKFGKDRILSPEQEKEIKKIIVEKYPDQLKFECCLWTPGVVKMLIEQKFNIKISKQGMRDYLERWGMTCQRPAKQARKQNHQNTETFKNEVYPKLKRLANSQNAEIFYADETGINNQAHNLCGYAPKNNPPVVKFETSRETVNMLSAVSPSGEFKFMFYEEKMSQQKLIEFMVRLIKDKKKSKIFLFLDNLQTHHGKLVKDFAEKNKQTISIYYFPSYSPEINPQEYLNNILKQNIHSGLPPKNKKEIKEKTQKFMDSVPQETVKNLFNHPKLTYQKVKPKC